MFELRACSLIAIVGNDQLVERSRREPLNRGSANTPCVARRDLAAPMSLSRRPPSQSSRPSRSCVAHDDLRPLTSR